MSAEIAIRDGVRSDWPYVYQSFAEEYLRSPHGKPLGETKVRRCIGVLLQSPAWQLTVAAPKAGDEIYGWVLHNAASIAWLHVKEIYRRNGFARALLNTLCVSSGTVDTPFVPMRTSVAPNFPQWAATKGYRIRHRPHILLRELLIA
jgi:GNAT superfamily N-acetyltransferase